MRELYWVITNGIQESGMPASGSFLSERTRWQVVAYVRTLAGIKLAFVAPGTGGSYADYIGTGFLEIEFHNTGLHNIDGRGGYPAPNTGGLAVSEDREDMGRFKAPSLRNIAETAPYMHDGSIATLDGEPRIGMCT